MTHNQTSANTASWWLANAIQSISTATSSYSEKERFDVPSIQTALESIKRAETYLHKSLTVEGY